MADLKSLPISPDGDKSAAVPGASTARNVLANWIWYFLVLVSGFVLPRLMSDHLGRELLGVWDLGWSVVFYVRWLHLGVTASVNRYVARHRALADWDGLNHTVNTSLALLLTACGIGFLLGAVFAWFVPVMLPGQSAELVRSARHVVLLLCATAALQLPGGVFNAVITGCQRFDLLSIIRGARDGAVMIAIIVLLLGGHGLVPAACAVLTCEVLSSIAKVVVARRLCSQLRFSPSLCNAATARTLVVFGGKTVAQGFSRGSLYQVNSLLVAWFLGPATLAIFTRQRALVVHALRFMKQYAQVFIPRSSVLDAGGDAEALQALLITSTRYGLYMTLPIMLLLLVMGGPLLNVWMGADYQAPVVLAILAVGHLLIVPQQSVYSILMGMDRHGRPALYDLAAFVVSVVLGLVLMAPPLQMGMMGAAIAVSAPLALSSGIVMPIHACRLLKLGARQYLRRVLPGPLLASIPFLCSLVLARVAWSGNPSHALLFGTLIGGSITVCVYCRWVIPPSLRNRLLARLSFPAGVHETKSERMGA